MRPRIRRRGATRRALHLNAERISARRVRVRGLARDVDLRVRLATLDAIADLRVQDDARPQIDRVALLLPARAESYRSHADAVGGDGADERGARRDEALDTWRTREPARVVDGSSVATLGGHELAQLREPAAVR